MFEHTKHQSQWQATTDAQSLQVAQALPPQTDTVIVGAGLAGLTTAALLTRAGKKVVVLEMHDAVGAGDTGQTTAHITSMLDVGYSEIAKNFGKEGAKLAAEAQEAAISTIETLVQSNHIACDFKRLKAYLYTTEASQAQEVDDELEAMREAGLNAQPCDSVPLPFKTVRALELDGQAQFQPLAYLAGLVKAIREGGGTVVTGTRVTDVKEGGDQQVVTTDKGEIRAREVVIATHTPPNRLALQLSLTPQRTYAIAYRCKTPPTEALFYDTDEPYHYIRRHPHKDHDLLIVGGCDHRSGSKSETDDSYADLDTYARAHFGVGEAVYRWSGQVFIPADGLPYVGLNPGTEHTRVITGLSGNGMTWGTVGALVCAQGVLGNASPWAELLRPGRFKPVAQAGEVAKHTADVAVHFVKDRVKAWLTKTALGEGEGAIMREGAHTVAAFNDGAKTHLLSPICPHAGCYVQFNKGEKTWDCPCHGSRFACDGKLLSGPAVSDLKRLDG